jgi:hypothetical protein
LRAQAIGGNAVAPPARGLAMFLRRGLPAWLKSWERIPLPPTPAAATCRPPDPELLPLGLQAEAVVLLANMALGERKEGVS